jgi:hypothetical protein
MKQVRRGGGVRGCRGRRWKTPRAPEVNDGGRAQAPWLEGAEVGRVAGTVTSIGSGLGSAMVATSRPRPAATSREVAVMVQH